MRTINIGIWGDSITYGAWEGMGGWADRLRRYLHEKELAEHFETYYWVYNLGVPGETSEDIRKRFEIEAGARTPNLTIFAVGVNDSCKGGDPRTPRVPLPKYHENMQALVRTAKQYSEDIILVGLVLLDETITQPFDEEDAWFTHTDMLAYNAVLEEVAKEEEVLYVDILNLLAPEDLYDGLHPNVEGHRKMFEFMRDFLLVHGVL